MKHRISLLLILTISLVALSSHAVAGVASLTDVSPTDKSLESLRYIFGNIVDVIIGGTGPDAPDSMIGALSEVLNVGMLVFTGLIIGFVYINGIMNSAADGTPLGKSYDTIWVPLRMILAMGLVLPYQGGYSSMQTGVIWIAGHGIGMANTTWKAALGFMKDTGSLYPPQVTFQFEDVAQNVLNSRYCLRALNKADLYINVIDKVDNGGGSTAPPDYNDLKDSGAIVEMNSGFREIASYARVSYTGALTTAEAAARLSGDGRNPQHYPSSVCGTIGFTFFEVDNSLDYKSELSTFNSAVVDAVVQLDAAMDAIAIQIVDNAALPEDQRNPGPIAPNEFAAAVAAFQSSYMSAAQAAASSIAQKRIDWWAGGNPVTSTQTIGSIEAGWITAGSWYWDIQRINKTTQDILSARPYYSSPGDEYRNHKDIKETYNKAFNHYLDGRSAVAEFGAPVNNQADSSYISNDFPGGADGDDGILAGYKKMANRWSITFISARLRNGLTDILTTPDPVTSLSSFGHTILSILESMYVVKVGLTIALGAAEESMIGKTVDFITGGVGVFRAIIDVFSELFYGLVLSMGPFALFMAFYLPAIPMILWVMGVAGWFILLIEAVIAAPLWAASHAMPEGQGFVGQRAMAGYMVLLSLFIRPTLMLIGFLASMMLMVVMGRITLLVVIPAITSANAGDGLSGLATLLAGIAILTMLMIQIAHRAFGLQTELPDKILRYIGGGGEQLGEQDNERQGRNVFVAGASIGSKTMQGNGSESLKRKKKPENPTTETDESKKSQAALAP